MPNLSSQRHIKERKCYILFGVKVFISCPSQSEFKASETSCLYRRKKGSSSSSALDCKWAAGHSYWLARLLLRLPQLVSSRLFPVIPSQLVSHVRAHIHTYVRTSAWRRSYLAGELDCFAAHYNDAQWLVVGMHWSFLNVTAVLQYVHLIYYHEYERKVERKQTEPR